MSFSIPVFYRGLFLFAAVAAETVELKHVPCDSEAFFLGFFLIYIRDRAYIYAFGSAAFRAYEMMVVVPVLCQLVHISRCTVYFVNYTKLREHRKVAVNRIKGHVRICFSYFGEKLLRSGKVFKGIESLQYRAPLRSYFIAF